MPSPAPHAAEAAAAAPHGTGMCDLMGVQVQGMTPGELCEMLRQVIPSRRRFVVAAHNLHSVYLCRHDAMMRQFYALADRTYIDGMPLVFLGRAVGHPLKRAHRVTMVDFLPVMLDEAAAKGWRVFWVGGDPTVVERGAGELRRRHPGLSLAVHHGYFDAQGPDNDSLVEQINAYRPDLLMVGMGMPRQERWIVANRDRLDAAVIWRCGAAMDYVAGHIATPPRWMGRLGLEWLYRLASEPGRLWRRYLVEPWTLVGLAIRDLCRMPGRRRR